MAVEEMISAKVIVENPGLMKSEIVVGLSNVEDGSIRLQFTSSLEKLTSEATKSIALSIESQDFYSLPEESIKSLKSISEFTRNRDCNAELYELNGRKKLLAIITPETQILEYEPLIGETIIYGTVTRVGGANEEKPTIQFRTIDGKLIYCAANKANAKIAATHLYREIGLSGDAEWDAKTLEIQSFHVREITEYEDAPLSEAFQAIKDTYGNEFDAIEDVDAFVKELRHGV
ncbi:MAG: hypothetical protein AAGI69_26330 [Cyanobacteria bacterium P01_H01_bin.21]